jgi:hypothetical protein
MRINSNNWKELKEQMCVMQADLAKVRFVGEDGSYGTARKEDALYRSRE